jgi:hypothetical protein
LPAAPVALAAFCFRAWQRLRGRQSGLDPLAFVSLQTRETFFDPAPARAALGFAGHGLDAALAETVAACRPG